MVKYRPLMATKNYERFHGNSRFYCWGRLVSANQIGILIFVAVVIVVTACLYLAFDARFFVTNLRPIGVGVVFPVGGLLFLFYSLAFLFKTGCIDPGIVPRAYPDEISYNLSLGNEDPNSTAKGYVGTAARYKTVEVRGQQLKLKWCPTCNIWRPPRASHCGLCNNCLEQFDHHCPWVGNCVAKRNYRYFYLFLVTVCVGAVYTLGCNVAVIVVASKQMGFGNALKTYPASVIEFCIAGLAVMAVTGLAAMHTWLIARMVTTNEDIKGTFNPRRQGTDVRNPYQQRHCCYNFAMVVCGPFHPSLIQSTKEVDESFVAMEEEESGVDGGYGSTGEAKESPVRTKSPTSRLPPPVTSSKELQDAAAPETPDTHVTDLDTMHPATGPAPGNREQTTATVESSLSPGPPSESSSTDAELHVDLSGTEGDVEKKHLIQS